MDSDFEEMEVSQRDKLMALRNMVKLNPIDFLKVKRACVQAEKFRDLYIKENPSDIIGVDYSIAEDLEYQLRLSTLERSMEREWRSYLDVEHDGLGLREYALGYLDQYMKEQSSENVREGRRM
jgi:hypothetical protein